MDAILPFKIKNEQKFFESALKVGYNEMEAIKFIYVVQQSDLDIFPKMQDERINILLYGWELCEDYKQKLNPNEWELPEEMEMVLKLLVSWSMDIWFSKEWDKCKYFLKTALIHCLNRARDLLMRMPDMMQINWDFLLLYNLKPWNVLYLKNLNVTKEKTIETGAQSIETEELPPNNEDISYVKLEQLPIIVLRLVKIFDQSSIDMVKTLCMRVITAWNKIHQTELETSGSRRPYIPPEDKRCLMLICHIYLMAVYESDDVKGYVIDNMINNIRFYFQGFQNSSHSMGNLEYTPARYIALTNIHLRVQKRDFFDFFIWNKYDTSLVNLFGVVSQAYKSYLLGNLLMELNNMNEDDFVSNIPLYKRLMNSYVNEREKSEIFLLNELNKTEAQRYAHNIIQTVKNVTDFKSKICKGNRMSNIGNYENSDDTVTPLSDLKLENNKPEIKEDEIKDEVLGEEIEDEQERVRVKESELRVDPVFQFLPNNESILYYVYDVLAKKDYIGWHFAKIVILVKIIGLEQNMIETWRYHPGLTTDFMLSLEVKLSDHYVDLAKIFKEHPFLQQEFWLTAFYLNPTSELYEIIKRLGMRNNRKRTDEHTKLVMSVDNIEAKYGLLSSTIDVKELALMSNTDDPVKDYDPLFSVLHSLRVPDSLVKDMLTAIFLPRNRSFAWAVDWVILRNRCKMIMTSSKEKKRFVDLNMAEANDRLKYLIIDYEKYKNRPQLDYGTIEEGYENLMTSGEFDKESEEEEEDEEEDFEDDEDVYESKRRGRRSMAATARKKEEEKVQDDNSQEDDPFLMGKRRTRARTAATLASFLFQTLPRSSRRKRNQKHLEEEDKNYEEKISAENDDKSSDSKSPVIASQSPIPTPSSADSDENNAQIADIPTKNLKECLKERPSFLNTTQGFLNLVDIWNVEKSDLQSVDENCVSLMESSTALQIAVKLKLLNKEINPMVCDEKEFIDDQEMIIHNAEFVIKKEIDMEVSDIVQEPIKLRETAVTMEIDDTEANVETDKVSMTIVSLNLGQPVEPEESEEPDFKISKDYGFEKASGREIDENVHKQALPPVDENSCESINSDISTAAHKDSGEVSESNTEINSKRNSLNIDTDMEYKMIQNCDLNERSETATELKETSEPGLQIANEKDQDMSVNLQNNANMEESDVPEQENLAEEENKPAEEHKSEEESAMERENETPQGSTCEQLSIGIDNKISEEPKDLNEENETKESETQKFENNDTSNHDKLSETPKDLDSGNINQETDMQQLQNNEGNNPNKISKEPEDKNNKNGNGENATTQQLENNDDAKSNEVITKEILEVLREKSPDKKQTDLQSNNFKESENIEITENSKDILTSRDKSLQEQTNILEVKSQQSLENEDFELEIAAYITERKKNTENKVNNNEETGHCAKELEIGNELKSFVAHIIETNNSCPKPSAYIPALEHKKAKLESTESKSSDDKGSSTQSTNDVSMLALHYSSSENFNETSETTDRTKLANSECKNNNAIADQEIFKAIDGEKGTDATVDQEKLEISDLKNVCDVTGDETKIETSDGNRVSHSPNILLDEINADSIQTTDDEECSSDVETQYLKNLCLTRNVKILLHKLRPEDLTNLRQPKVKIPRVSYEKYVAELRAKRRCITRKVYLEFADSSNSNNSLGTNASSSDVYHPTKVKRKIPVRRHSVRQVRTSESDNDTNNSDDLKLSTILANSRKRRLSTPSTSQSSTSRHITGPKSARKMIQKSARRTAGPKSSKQHLVVTPRSASGLKLRISNAEQTLQETGPLSKRSRGEVFDEVIQLSSSSDEYVLDELTAIEEVIEVEEYPLFEEEIII